ncbi:hypothetical protein [Nocardioides sp. GXZ039]|uniref:hypothetical protein n=1 Tax=Nocardioides sp. GXZ039 TaxID=3136018 RepID=UPI0030F42B13
MHKRTSLLAAFALSLAVSGSSMAIDPAGAAPSTGDRRAATPAGVTNADVLTVRNVAKALPAFKNGIREVAGVQRTSMPDPVDCEGERNPRVSSGRHATFTRAGDRVGPGTQVVLEQVDQFAKPATALRLMRTLKRYPAKCRVRRNDGTTSRTKRISIARLGDDRTAFRVRHRDENGVEEITTYWVRVGKRLVSVLIYSDDVVRRPQAHAPLIRAAVRRAR